MLPDAQHRPPDTALSGVLLAHCFFSVSDAQPSYSPGPTCLRPRAQLLLLFFSIHTCWDFVPTHGCESHQDAGDPSARSPAPTSPLSSRPYVQWLTLHLCFPSNRLLLSMTCPAPNSDPHPHQTFSPKQPHPSRSGLNLTLFVAHFTSNPSANSAGLTFQVHLQSYHSHHWHHHSLSSSTLLDHGHRLSHLYPEQPE